MHYEEAKPGPAAGRFVQCYWMLTGPPGTSGVRRIVPDGCPELIVNFGDAFESWDGANWSIQPRRFVAGQITGPMLVRPTGSVKLCGIRFRPYGAGPILNAPIHELTGCVAELNALAPRVWRELEQLDATGPFTAISGLLDRVMANRVSGSNDLMASITDEIASTGGAIDIAGLAAQAGLSSRQMERRFKSAVGIPPKLFCRIQRFQRVFQVMESERGSWIDAALNCGYYDQAHLIRDFREFAGETPSVLLSGKTDLAAEFLQYRSASHSSNTESARSL